MDNQLPYLILTATSTLSIIACIVFIYFYIAFFKNQETNEFHKLFLILIISSLIFQIGYQPFIFAHIVYQKFDISLYPILCKCSGGLKSLGLTIFLLTFLVIIYLIKKSYVDDKGSYINIARTIGVISVICSIVTSLPVFFNAIYPVDPFRQSICEVSGDSIFSQVYVSIVNTLFMLVLVYNIYVSILLMKKYFKEKRITRLQALQCSITIASYNTPDTTQQFSNNSPHKNQTQLQNYQNYITSKIQQSEIKVQDQILNKNIVILLCYPLILSLIWGFFIVRRFDHVYHIELPVFFFYIDYPLQQLNGLLNSCFFGYLILQRQLKQIPLKQNTMQSLSSNRNSKEIVQIELSSNPTSQENIDYKQKQITDFQNSSNKKQDSLILPQSDSFNIGYKISSNLNSFEENNDLNNIIYVERAQSQVQEI